MNALKLTFHIFLGAFSAVVAAFNAAAGNAPMAVLGLFGLTLSIIIIQMEVKYLYGNRKQDRR